MRNNFNEFKEYIRDKRVTVIGIGVSNIPLIRCLIALGAEVNACDKTEDIGTLYDEFTELGVKLSLGDNYLDNIYDSEVIFRTPSMLPTNKVLVGAIEKGIYVTSEIAEFMKYCPCKMIGVTGSDGKTTTTTLIGEMLRREGHKVYVGGNIGTPLFNQLEDMKSKDYVVLELSSFQLMDIEYSPEVAVITNITPNHLDIHSGMEEYIAAKKKLYKDVSNNQVVILNLDNKLTSEIRAELQGKSRMFSLSDDTSFSYCKNGALICNGSIICDVADIKLPGQHNIENLLAAFSAVNDFVSISSMKYVAENFAGVEHRIEFVRELKGIKFYNDSIASSPTRTLAGLNSFKQKVILIAGGYDKKIPFEELAEKGLDRIKVLVLMGDAKEKMKSVFIKEMEKRNTQLLIIDAVSFEDAVRKAYENANNGDIITMSPACASFDMFKNFEVRGNAYKDIVNNLK